MAQPLVCFTPVTSTPITSVLVTWTIQLRRPSEAINPQRLHPSLRFFAWVPAVPLHNVGTPAVPVVCSEAS
jgi:hypothetical protein